MSGLLLELTLPMEAVVEVVEAAQLSVLELTLLVEVAEVVEVAQLLASALELDLNLGNNIFCSQHFEHM